MSTTTRSIPLAEANVGDQLTWQREVHVDPSHSAVATFTGTLVEPPIIHEGQMLLTVAGPGGWHRSYEVSPDVIGAVTVITEGV